MGCPNAVCPVCCGGCGGRLCSLRAVSPVVLRDSFAVGGRLVRVSRVFPGCSGGGPSTLERLRCSVVANDSTAVGLRSLARALFSETAVVGFWVLGKGVMSVPRCFVAENVSRYALCFVPQGRVSVCVYLALLPTNLSSSLQPASGSAEVRRWCRTAFRPYPTLLVSRASRAHA